MSLRTFMPVSRYFAGTAEDPFVSLNRFLQGALSDASSTTAIPVRLDIKEDEKAFHVTADLPGLSEKDVDVTFDDGVLTIRGQKKVERDEKKDTWHVVERFSGSFARQLALATSVDAAAIEAKFEKGVLTILLPKMTEEKTSVHKIEVKAS